MWQHFSLAAIAQLTVISPEHLSVISPRSLCGITVCVLLSVSSHSEQINAEYVTKEMIIMSIAISSDIRRDLDGLERISVKRGSLSYYLTFNILISPWILPNPEKYAYSYCYK